MLFDKLVTKSGCQRHLWQGIRNGTFVPASRSTSGVGKTGGGRWLLVNHRQSNRYKSSIPVDSMASSSSSTTTRSSLHHESSTTYLTGIVTALVAATAGVMTVSGVASLVESQTAHQVPKFDVHNQRFDTTTYFGRFYHMLLQCDPYLLSYTNQQVMDAKHLVDCYLANQRHYQQEGRDGTTPLDPSDTYHDETIQNSNTTHDHDYDVALHRQLWEAKRIYESAMNDSGAIVPRPFRMSGYVPYNGPICVMMISSTTTASILLWSWVNQSQNAFVNYYNRSNSSQPINMNTFLQSYMIAVSSALCVAFGLATFIQKRYSPQRAQQLLRYVAFPSAVVASSLNCYIVRSPEISTGIPLCDKDGNNVMLSGNSDHGDDMEMILAEASSSTDSEIDAATTATVTTTTTTNATSKIAAARGVYATTASRALLQAPVYFLPPLLMSVVCSKKLLSSPTKLLPITTYLLLCSFGFGLPAACAIFPQTSTIAASDVESHFQSLINPKTQQPYTMFYYDKGL